MKDTLITLLHSRAGAAIQWLAGLLIGWLSAQLVALGIELEPDAWHQLETGLTALGAFAVTFGVQWYQARQAARLQATLGARPDGWIGSETLATAESIRSIADSQILKP